ncbi:hypothetical protein [Sinorhizobium medicae]|uniref:hypothetical protein n=1 Tax=Sinorhizobium medicae TaxID=110321 RepID=UPI001F18DF9F|nr:hypothetical protein [Sinorhizobium medicae]
MAWLQKNGLRLPMTLELALKLADGLPRVNPSWLEGVLQTLATYKGEKVCHGAPCVAPKENVPNGATRQAEKKNPA